ncbi:hypothetical protein DFP73DRAFT_566128 [Morchella snyderi]|nr:hypothetical protein DFP73DRAFT_566128 [Morchella snyderi]
MGGACLVVGKQPGPNLMLVAIIHVGQNIVCLGLEYRLERMSQGLDHSQGMHGASLPVGCWFFLSFPFSLSFSLPPSSFPFLFCALTNPI